jgi:hypothetical protein
MTTAVARKLGLNPGMRARIIAPPPGYLKMLRHGHQGLLNSAKTGGGYTFVQVFATRLADIGDFAKKLRKYAAPNALIWISYPKQTSKLKGDLSRDVIRETMSDAGWRAVPIVAIDEIWSALRFRPEKDVGSRPRPRAG